MFKKGDGSHASYGRQKATITLDVVESGVEFDVNFMGENTIPSVIAMFIPESTQLNQYPEKTVLSELNTRRTEQRVPTIKVSIFDFISVRKEFTHRFRAEGSPRLKQMT